MKKSEDRRKPTSLDRSEGNQLDHFLASLTPEKRHEVDQIAQFRTIPAGEVVFEEGQAPTHVGYVLDGTLAMTKMLPDGRVHIVGLLVPTDMYGRIFAGQLGYRVQALAETKVYCFETQDFERLLENAPEIEHYFMVHLLDELDAAREWILLLGGHKVIERVASFILILSRRQSRLLTADQIKPAKPFEVNVAIQRKDLAHYLGTRPETLSRAIHDLERRKAVRIINPQTFEIIDLKMLVEIAGHDLIVPGN